jgi:hypothetical protein
MRTDPRRLLAMLAVAVTLGGCATTPVKPWQRARLAQWDMRLDPDPMAKAMAQHAHFSKEGTAGDIGAAGGGCGCN